MWSDSRLGKAKGGLTEVQGDWERWQERTKAAPGFLPTEIKRSGVEEDELGLEVERGAWGTHRDQSSQQRSEGPVGEEWDAPLGLL